MKHRLQKLLAQANYGSRRATEDLITAGRVKVNGEVAILGTKADPEVDTITLDGEKLDLKTPPVYLAFYKPVNVISSTERQPGDDRPTVREMIPIDGHLFSLGRLDVESEGLIVLTNDGDLTNKLTHPRYEHTKTYQVTVYGTPDRDTVDRWQRGIMLTEDDGIEIQTAPCYVQVMRRDGDTALLKVVMTEGRNRQIRRVAAALGHPVKSLVRTHIGRYGIGKMKRGDYVEMSAQDLRLLTTPATELEDIQKIKAQAKNQQRRARYMALSSASPEQIDEARRNKPAPAPRPGKKYQDRGEGRGPRDDRRRPSGGPRRDGPSAGRRPGAKPGFRSRLMLDETGERTPGARRHGQSDTPEGFRSRLSDTDRPQRRSDSRGPRGEERPTFRSRLSEVDRPQRAADGQRRQFSRDDDRPRRPYNRDDRGGQRSGEGRSGDDRGPRRPYNRDDRGGQRASGEGRSGDDRPRRPYNRDDRGGQRASGEGRSGDDRGPRRPYNRDDRGGQRASGEGRGRDDRGPRSGAPREAGGRDGRPPRRTFNRDDRGGEQRGTGERREGQGRPQRRDGDSRPPRREGTGEERPRRAQGRPDGQGTRGERGTGDRSRGPRREGERSSRTGGEQREGRQSGGPRRERSAGTEGRRPSGQRPAGSEGRRPPPRRDDRGGQRSAGGDRPARPPRKRPEDEE